MKRGRLRSELCLATALVLGICGIGWLGCSITSANPDMGGAGGSTGGGTGGAVMISGAGGWMGPAPLPCDAFAAGGGPCVAAHSTVRALYAAYNGPLYQVRRASDSMTMDILPLEPGGFANAADQDTFCATGACTISIIYDQSGHNNNLTKAPAGGQKTTPDNEANAKALPVTISGHNVYGVHIVPGIGYRNNTPNGTAVRDDPETEYMVAGGTFYNGGCCFDYGNMETTSRDDGEGTMEAVYFGTCTIWGRGDGNGPWVMGDLENGLWAGNISPFPRNVPINYKYVTGMVKGDDAGKNHWTIKAGNAQTGGFDVPFNGQRPSSRYNPMRKEGAIGLGTGGDNSNSAQGNFFEGVMTTTYSPDATDDAVQANIVSVYGQ
jgi:hypothetical protein